MPFSTAGIQIQKQLSIQKNALIQYQNSSHSAYILMNEIHHNKHVVLLYQVFAITHYIHLPRPAISFNLIILQGPVYVINSQTYRRYETIRKGHLGEQRPREPHCIATRKY